MMTLGEKIQTLRKQNAMSQDQLADMLGVSRQAVSKWENDENNPELEYLVQISSIFSVSTDYLVKDGNSSSVTFKLDKGKIDETNRMRASKISMLVSAIYSSALVIFLILGFGWGLWHPAWIIFFVPPVLSRFLAHAMSKSAEDYEAFEEAIRREDD